MGGQAEEFGVVSGGLNERYRHARPPLNRPRAGTLTRSGNWTLVGTVAAMAALASVQFSGLWSSPFWLWLSLIVIGTSAATALNVVDVRCTRREAIACRGRMCLECRFPFPTDQTDGICPECGTLYDVRATRAAWRSELALSKEQTGETEGDASNQGSLKER